MSQPALSETARKKVIILSESQIMTELPRIISSDNLPRRYGGNAIDPTDHPKIRTSNNNVRFIGIPDSLEQAISATRSIVKSTAGKGGHIQSSKSTTAELKPSNTDSPTRRGDTGKTANSPSRAARNLFKPWRRVRVISA